MNGENGDRRRRMGQEVSMDTERMDSWETVMRVVYPVKDAEQTLPLYAIDWTRPHVAETTLDSRIDMRRLEFSSMNQSTLQRMLRNAGSSNGVSCDSFEITGRTSVTLRDHGHMSGCTFFNAFPASYWRRWGRCPAHGSWRASRCCGRSPPWPRCLSGRSPRRCRRWSRP